MPVKKEISENMPNQWQIGLCDAPVKNPVGFAYACCCPWCAAYQQRDTLLKITGEDYYCCGGTFPCLCLKNPMDKNCLFIEACCCHSCAFVGNRYIIQTRFMIANSPCDDMILTFICVISWTICILEMAGVDVPDEIEQAVDCLINSVYSCMWAQQQKEIEKIKQTQYQPPPETLLVMLPPTQQKMITTGVIVAQPGAPQQPMQMQPVGQQQMQYR